MSWFSLLCVLVVSKLATVWDRELTIDAWTMPAMFWQDIALAAGFACLAWCVRKPVVIWSAYAVIVAYTAINVAVVRVLSTPLTWPMLRATDATISDSISAHATPGNLMLMTFVAAFAVSLPLLLRNTNERQFLWGWLILLPAIPLGMYAVTRTETHGLHRNAVVTLALTTRPRIGAKHAVLDWRRSPFGQSRGKSLVHLRGTCKGSHVVLIVLESAGAQYLKPWGAKHDPMPFLTKLSKRGVLFENAYTMYPESIKGLIAMLSSVSPALDTKAEQYATIGRDSLARALKREGYRTGLFHSGRFMYLGMESVVRDRGFDALEDAGHISGEHHSSFGVDEPSAVQRMLQWVDSREGDTPFFLTYMPIAGHHPYESPVEGPFEEHTEEDRYRNALHYADSAIKTLIKGFERRGLARNTLFVIVGDHGQAFAQHPGNYGHTFFIYEENVRIPMLLVPPRQQSPVRIQRPASALDVAPTMLDLLGIAKPTSFEGRSLLEASQRMALFFTDYSLALLGLRDGRWKFIDNVESQRAKLFDLETDPDEKRNAASRYPARVAAYRERLRRWSAAQRAKVLNKP